MTFYRRILIFAALAALASGCAPRRTTKPVTPQEAKAKIAIDLSRLDADGLVGPPNGKRSLHYEFCIPGDDATIAEVRAIDSSLEITKGARGRVGCGPTEALAIGSTHQKNHLQVLEQLALKPYIKVIREAVFER